MPRISEESIRKVAESLDIVDVVGSYLSLKRAGSAFKGLCPFHKEKTPSFTVNPARQSFHCFGCGAGGGVIRFVMDYEHLPFQDAVRKLARQAGVQLVEESGGTDSDSTRSLRSRLLELHREAADWFHRQLRKNPAADEARTYLRSREINSAIAANWLLGYAPAESGGFLKFARARGFSEEELSQSGLCGRSEDKGHLYERFRGRIMIPIHNDYGEVVGFSGRILDATASTAKYVNSPETPIFVKGKLLFGLHKTKRALIAANEAVVCEGQFDLITAFERGVQNVVAPQGTAFTPHQAGMLKRFVATVVLCFDSDAAGEKAVERSLPALFGHSLAVRVLELPKGEDPDSVIRRAGGDSFLERVRAAGDLLDVLAGRAERSGALKSPAGIAATARRFAGILKLIPDAVLRDASLNQVAARLRISTSQLSELVRKSRDPSSELPVEEETRPSVEAPPLPEAFSVLCRLAMNSAEAREWLVQNCSEEEIGATEGWPALQVVLNGTFDPSNPDSVAGFLATCDPIVERQLAALDNRHMSGQPLATARATLHGIRREILTKQREIVKTRLLEPGIPANGIFEIQKELLDLQKRLNELPPPAFVETSE